jgi:hypothetical protein
MLLTAPGMSIRSMRQGSNVDARWPSSMASHGYVQPQGAHTVALTVADEVLSLPEGLFTIVETRHGVVARIHCTPQLDHLPFEEAFALCCEIEQRLVERGFVGDSIDKAEAEQRLSCSRGETRVSRLAAPHGSGSWQAELRLRRLVDSGGVLAKNLGLDHDGFIVTLVLWDPPLLDTAP